MTDVEQIHEDLDADVSLEAFREAVEAKVEQMGGLADEETAAMLVAHELGGGRVDGVADIEPGQEEVSFVAKVLNVGEVRTFDRDDGEEGRVCNVEVADETGAIRAAFWDEQAVAAENELEAGTVLRIKGRPKDGFNGVEVSVLDAEPDEDTEIDIQIQDTYAVDDLSLGLSDVNCKGKVLDVGSIRTFERDDGSEGKVANASLGDETGRVRVTMWDDAADYVEDLEAGQSVEVVDGYVRERDGSLELHVGSRGAIEQLDEDVEYVPERTPIADLEIGQTVDIAGVVRSADPKRTFDRDDGSEGQVRNLRVQDDTGDVRVALWGDLADRELGPGDEVALGDVEIKDGWQEDLEASAGWRSTVVVLDGGATVGATGSGPTVGRSADSAGDGASDDSSEATGLSAFADGAAGSGADGDEQAADDATSEDATADETSTGTDDLAEREGEEVEFTGAVVQAGSPVVLYDGETTMKVDTDADVHLGTEVTARGTIRDGAIDADDVF